MVKLVIHGQTVSQKNAKKVAYNPRTKKPFIMSEKRVKDWQEEAIKEVKEQYTGAPLVQRQQLEIMFYVKDNRRRDLDNMLTSVQDVLKNAGVLIDDSWRQLRIGMVDAQIDTKNPRAEILLLPIDL